MSHEMRQRLNSVIEAAQLNLNRCLAAIKSDGGLTQERYVRLLSYQYHLTSGVQRHFLAAAAHPDLAHRRGLRRFLFEFANEEELHFEIAHKDLANLGHEPLPCPLDVKLWWSYFDGLVMERPFVRLGATCILENIAGKAGDLIGELFRAAAFLGPRNTRFIEIHKHDERLPHGEQILQALDEGNLEERHWRDVLQGAEEAQIMYIRFVEWAFFSKKAA